MSESNPESNVVLGALNGGIDILEQTAGNLVKVISEAEKAIVQTGHGALTLGATAGGSALDAADTTVQAGLTEASALIARAASILRASAQVVGKPLS